MRNIFIDFNETDGKMKPMHAVNNGPAGSRVRKGNSTFAYFEEAGIPYARNHDAAFCQSYGGEYTVDVHRIFRNFDADPTIPESYDFECTDTYVMDTFSVGAEVYYRLGSSIEHGKKMGTFPPKDFKKWAVICEHIIRHYTEGWANGYTYPITYWEIWNEPDCRNGDGSNPCWQGSEEEFIELFCITISHLKECFPHLKVGGPAFCYACTEPGARRTVFIRKFFTALKERGLSLDFFSYHGYDNDPEALIENSVRARGLCDEFGYPNAELHLNEWNYVHGWTSDEWTYSLRAEKGLKGSSFTAATMAVGQESPTDILMYYDARPCGMNGMFDTDFLTPLKGYYPFRAFGELYKMGNFVKPKYEKKPIYCTAARSECSAGILLTNYAEDDNAPTEDVKITLTGVDGMRASLYLLDGEHSLELIKTLPKSEEITLTLPLFSTYFVSLEK